MLFSDLMQAGLLGIAQAVLVVTAVWFVCVWTARRLQVDDEFATCWRRRCRFAAFRLPSPRAVASSRYGSGGTRGGARQRLTATTRP
jgi:hypothetical protein